MEKKNNKKGLIALAVVLVLAIAALIIWQVNTSDTIYTDAEYLSGALEQENLIEGTESEYGLYVTTVDGETADDSKQEWWGYSVNGEFAELGVDSQPVADGDVYDFVLNVGW